MLHSKYGSQIRFSTSLSALLFVLVLSCPPVFGATLDIENIRVAKNGTVTRIVFDTNYIPKYRIFTLNNPSRVVIDFANGRLATEVNQSLFKSSLVKQLRHARRKNEKLRVVLDLHQSIIPKSFVLPPHENAKHRLVIDLKGTELSTKQTDDVKSTAKVSAKAKTNSKKTSTKVSAKPKTSSNKTSTKVSAKPKTSSNKTSVSTKPKQDIIAKVTTPPAIKKKAKKESVKPKAHKTDKLIKPRQIVVAIDPGHGGKDPGATGFAGTREKDVVLQISKRLARLVNAEPGMRAVMTRDKDTFLTLRGRIKKARQQKADVFLSIHADAVDDRRVRGSSVYVLSKNGASSEAAKILAQRENNADVIGGVSLEGKDKVLQKVIVDLSQTATIDASAELASHLLKELRLLGKTRKRIENAGFAVLKSPDIPSVLVETAFISNAAEERRLRSSEHQQKLANSIFRGVRAFLNKNPPDGSILAYRGRQEKHVIRSGETLSEIAHRYSVSLDALRSINALRSDKIRVGQKLIIPEV